MSIKKSNSVTTIKRLSLSPYWSEAFLSNEKSVIESLGFKYLFPSDTDSNCPDIFITNTHSNLNELSENERKNLKLIIHPNSGYDNFNVEFVNSVQCPIILGSSLRAKAVSEVILSEIFSRYSLAPKHDHWCSDRKWPRKILSEQKILIIGMGVIGNTIFQTLNPLVDDLFLHDPFKGYGQNLNPNVKFDIIVLAASLNPSSFNMIDAAFLKNLSPSGILINCARGELVCLKDLLEFLDTNPQAFAYLDVFKDEPFKLETIQRQNLKTSSHIAGVHASLEEKTQLFICEILKNFHALSSSDFYDTYKSINLKNRVTENFLI